MERLVTDGYIKMIAIDIHDLESTIVDERNTNYLCDVENFQRKYDKNQNVKCIYLHMDNNFEINFVDYQKINDRIHPFDYLRDLVKNKSGRLIEGNDYLGIEIKNEYLELK